MDCCGTTSGLYWWSLCAASSPFHRQSRAHGLGLLGPSWTRRAESRSILCRAHTALEECASHHRRQSGLSLHQTRPVRCCLCPLFTAPDTARIGSDIYQLLVGDQETTSEEHFHKRCYKRRTHSRKPLARKPRNLARTPRTHRVKTKKKKNAHKKNTDGTRQKLSITSRANTVAVLVFARKQPYVTGGLRKEFAPQEHRKSTARTPQENNEKTPQTQE